MPRKLIRPSTEHKSPNQQWCTSIAFYLCGQQNSGHSESTRRHGVSNQQSHGKQGFVVPPHHTLQSLTVRSCWQSVHPPHEPHTVTHTLPNGKGQKGNIRWSILHGASDTIEIQRFRGLRSMLSTKFLTNTARVTVSFFKDTARTFNARLLVY